MNIEQQNIDELLIAYLLQELDKTSSEQIELWIAESDENRLQFEQVKQVWNTTENTEQLEFNSDLAWNKVSARITPMPNIKPGSKPFLTSQLLLGVAATILLLIGSFIIFLNVDNEPQTTILYANNSITNDTLTDGSIIKLNNKSSLSYNENFNNDTREVRLKGEAFFDIKRDTTKAFIVNMDKSRVEVLGTSFNIKSKGDFTNVYVKSGLVKFEYLPEDTTKAYQAILLKAGEKVRYNKITHKILESKDSLLNEIETYWIDKKLVFDGIKLKKVIEILEVVYDVKIKAADKTINNCLLTVSFNNEDIEQIIEVIASTFKLEVEKNKNHYFLNGPSCESE